MSAVPRFPNKGFTELEIADKAIFWDISAASVGHRVAFVADSQRLKVQHIDAAGSIAGEGWVYDSLLNPPVDSTAAVAGVRVDLSAAIVRIDGHDTLLTSIQGLDVSQNGRLDSHDVALGVIDASLSSFGIRFTGDEANISQLQTDMGTRVSDIAADRARLDAIEAVNATQDGHITDVSGNLEAVRSGRALCYVSGAATSMIGDVDYSTIPASETGIVKFLNAAGADRWVKLPNASGLPDGWQFTAVNIAATGRLRLTVDSATSIGDAIGGGSAKVIVFGGAYYSL